MNERNLVEGGDRPRLKKWKCLITPNLMSGPGLPISHALPETPRLRIPNWPFHWTPTLLSPTHIAL